MSQLPSIYDEAASVHRHKGVLTIAMVLLIGAALTVVIRMSIWPYLPVLVDGAVETKRVPVHFKTINQGR